MGETTKEEDEEDEGGKNEGECGKGREKREGSKTVRDWMEEYG